jgi:3-oxoacyl-[acyl-carrier protein] reductase
MGQSTVELFRERGYTVVALDVAWPAERRRRRRRAADHRRRAVAGGRGRRRRRRARPGRGIDVVANIAGVYPPTTLASYDEATYRRIFDINVLGVLNVIAAARPRLSRGVRRELRVG